MSKRVRNVMDDAQDQLEFHHRQLAMRATERVRRIILKVPPTEDPEEAPQLRAMLQPIDALVLLFNLHYATRDVPASKKVVLTVNDCSLRASHPRLFDCFPLQPYIVSLDEEQRAQLITDIQEVLSAVKALKNGLPEDATDQEKSSAELLTDSNQMWVQVVQYIEALQEAAKLDEEDTSQDEMHRLYEGQLVGIIEATHGKQLEKLASELHSLMALGNAETDALNPKVYRSAYAMCVVQLAQQQLAAFEAEARQYPLDVPKEVVEEFRKQQELEKAMKDGENFTISEREQALAMEKDGEILGDDERIFMDELLHFGSDAKGGHRSREQRRPATAGAGPQRLKKPWRYAKVKAAYVWNQYNKTHYDSRSNPPPKQVRFYDFTLKYPEIASDPNRKPEYRVEPTEKGWEDEFVVLVISAGPPYADVAYRIVNKRWDQRPGGVNCSFDGSGRFKLYIRLTEGGYRR